MKKEILFSLILILNSAVLIGQKEANWKPDITHSNFGFKVLHKGVSFTVGEFREFDLDISSNGPGFLNAQIELSVDAASINTANDSRDNHLRSADFFDTEKHPKITFKSKKIKAIGENVYIVTGDFTMHGISKEIDVQMKHNGTVQSRESELAGFSFTTIVNRMDFGVGPELPIANVAAEVELHAEIEMIKE
ncbi:MAG: YceI family protein [Crocinitomicaceae bacterium]|nr:YceI family protein [Crocinitomicaceae bacterium]